MGLHPWLVYIDNQGLQRAFCLLGTTYCKALLYASSKIWKYHFECHACTVTATMWHDEDIRIHDHTMQVELIDPTNLMDSSTTLYLALGWCFCARVVYSGRGAQVKLGYTGNVW